MALWFKPAATPSGNAGLFYESTSSSGYTRFALFHQSTGTVQAIMRDSETGAPFAIATPSALTLNSWVHLAATIDSATGALLLYVNGAQVASNTAAKGVFTNTIPGDGVSVGRFLGGGSSAYVNGSIEDVALYGRALTAAEVSTIYNLP